MKKYWPLRLNKTSILALGIIVYSAYCLLLRENYLGSIASILAFSNHLHLRSHLLIIALLPIYISLIIFGAVLLGLYLGKHLEKIFTSTSFRNIYANLRKRRGIS